MPDKQTYRIDPMDPSPMNRFHSLDSPDEAASIVHRMIQGEVFPEVTLWRLHSYCQNAIDIGRLIERREAKKSNV